MARILIADDDRDCAELLLQLLKALGHDDTRVASTAAAAFDVAIEFVPSIIFLDIELPDMSGYEVALMLHQHPQLQHMRLIALTESGQHLGREQARTSGFERYLVKPLTATAVQEALETPS